MAPNIDSILKGSTLRTWLCVSTWFFGAFGEVWAPQLTKCPAESSHDYNLAILRPAFGEILSSNLTKCQQIHVLGVNISTANT